MNARTTFAGFLAVGIICSSASFPARSQALRPSSNANVADSQTPAVSPTIQGSAKPMAPVARAKVNKGKVEYTGPTNIVVLLATPMLDGEGKQRVDPDGNLMFNLPARQIRDKKGHPVYDDGKAPVFQTATNLGYDEKGKKIVAKKLKPAKMTPISISVGTLTVDGWTGKARLNYDIADLKYFYIYAPGIGTSIVSQNFFPGATEQPQGFNDQVLRITVDGHPIELSSEKRLLGKKPQSAWVMVDRGFALPAKFPVFGYGTTTRAPYVWPGSKQNVASNGPVQAPPLPADVRPALLLAPCPVGMMRVSGPVLRPGQEAADQPCVSIYPHLKITPETAHSTTASSSATPPPSPGH
jgi:hypothetical protein